MKEPGEDFREPWAQAPTFWAWAPMDTYGPMKMSLWVQTGFVWRALNWVPVLGNRVALNIMIVP